MRLGYDPATGVYLPAALETKTFGPLPAVSQFHDSLGYYPGLWYTGIRFVPLLLGYGRQRRGPGDRQLHHEDHVAR